jgi:hypothetical protein
MTLPQAHQGKSAGDLHEAKRQYGRAFVSLDESRCDGRIPPDRPLRADAAKERRERQQRHGSEHHQARAFQVVVFSHKRHNEETKANDSPDDRKVIQYQVEMRQIHEDSCRAK